MIGFCQAKAWFQCLDHSSGHLFRAMAAVQKLVANLAGRGNRLDIAFRSVIFHLIVVIPLIFAVPCRADRSANWRIFKAGDGLPESAGCAALSLSPKGNLWVRHSDSGEVSMLDGYEVQTYPSPGHDTYRVYESRTGQRWSLYSSGLVVYASGQWNYYPVPEIRAETPLRQIRQIPLLPAERDHVLFLLSDKLMEYNLNAKSALLLKAAASTSLGKFVEMTEARDGGIWISGARGLAKVAGPLRHVKADTPWREYLIDPGLGVENLQRPFEDEQGRLTVLAIDSRTSSKRVLLQLQDEKWTVRPLDTPSLRQAWPGWDQATWGFTRDSLLRFDSPPLSTVTREKIWGFQIRDVACETNGIFWLATSEGVLRYAPYIWRTPPAAEEVNSPVHAMVEDDQKRLWFASSDSLVCLDGESWKTFKWPEDVEGSFELGDRLLLLGDGRILATAGGRWLLLHPSTGRFDTISHPSGRRMRVVGQGQTRQILVELLPMEAEKAQGFTLEQFDGQKFEPFKIAGREPESINEVYFVRTQGNGDVWVGESGGLLRYRNGQAELFSAAQGFRGTKAFILAETAGGRLWCAGSDKILEFNGKSWAVLRSGFDRISQIVLGRDEKMWVATAQGLYSYANGTWVQHSVEEGLPSPSVAAVLVDTAGHLWSGTTRGLSRYHPESDISPPRTMKPILESPNGRAGEKTTVLLSAVDKWQLTPGDRLLYSTRLDGGQWSAFSESSTRVLEGLGAGKHRLDVKAMDRNWNEDTELSTLELTVVVPWSRDPRLLISLACGGFLILFFAAVAINRHVQLIRSYAEVERIVALRTLELERANQELLHSQKMKALGTLAAGVAHDFNNILSIIKGSAQIIQSNLEDRPKILTRLNRIQAVVEQGSGIVRSILGLSRVKEKELAQADLNGVVEDTLRLVLDRFPPEVTFDFTPARPLPGVLLVRELMQQMLLNLIFNAVDAMEQRGEVFLRTGELSYLPVKLALSPARATRYVFVSVQDSGCGIAPDVLPRIFEPFFTTKALSTRRGTGLGLSIIYEVARELGYGLEVNSAVAKGSTFTIILPVNLI